jgi:hypothetical protein
MVHVVLSTPSCWLRVRGALTDEHEWPAVCLCSLQDHSCNLAQCAVVVNPTATMSKGPLVLLAS